MSYLNVYILFCLVVELITNFFNLVFLIGRCLIISDIYIYILGNLISYKMVNQWQGLIDKYAIKYFL